ATPITRGRHGTARSGPVPMIPAGEPPPGVAATPGTVQIAPPGLVTTAAPPGRPEPLGRPDPAGPPDPADPTTAGAAGPCFPTRNVVLPTHARIGHPYAHAVRPSTSNSPRWYAPDGSD